MLDCNLANGVVPFLSRTGAGSHELWGRYASEDVHIKHFDDAYDLGLSERLPVAQKSVEFLYELYLTSHTPCQYVNYSG